MANIVKKETEYLDSASETRGDIMQTQEDFERIAEDYFMLIPPDTDYFDLDKCVKWEFNEFDRTLTFYFENEWDLDEFLDKIMDCPALEVTFEIGNIYEGVNRDKLTITIEGKEGGLY
jgi:hypothetical protein